MSAGRLVIRVKLIPKGPPPTPVWQRLRKGTLLVIPVAVAALLSWVGIIMLRTDATSTPGVTKVAPDAESQSPAAVPVPAPVVHEQPDAPPSPIHEVVPDVPRSARQTIRGTIKVSVRVMVDKEGTVVGAIAENRGPSRYFERLAVEAAKKWTFAPLDTQQQRIMLVWFSFTRAGTTARANPLQ